ncbi:MAG: swr complex subunit [Chaenotheca gracillima]|nr:MAG: swr complex subunit [Chaenotheca gracillima]
MHFTSIVSGLALAGPAFAQYGGGSYGASSPEAAVGTTAVAVASSVASAAATSAPTGTASSSGGVSVHVVKVSNKNKELVFSPADIKAAAGDMVQFQFYPMNHSIVQSTFDQPCQPIADNSPGTTGFFSGFMPVKPTDTQMPAYTIAINDTKPIWFYCSQGKHCQSGMVGVINAPAANKSRTLDSFKNLAKSAAKNVSPSVIEGGTSSSGSNSSTPTSAGSATGSGSASAPSSSSTLPLEANGVNSVVFESRIVPACALIQMEALMRVQRAFPAASKDIRKTAGTVLTKVKKSNLAKKSLLAPHMGVKYPPQESPVPAAPASKAVAPATTSQATPPKTTASAAASTSVPEAKQKPHSKSGELTAPSCNGGPTKSSNGIKSEKPVVSLPELDNTSTTNSEDTCSELDKITDAIDSLVVAIKNIDETAELLREKLDKMLTGLKKERLAREKVDYDKIDLLV